MATGRLGKGAAGTASNNVIYSCPASVVHATVNIKACNTSAVNRTLRLAIATSATPGANDYLDYNFLLEPGSRSEHTGVLMSPGEMVVAYSDGSGVAVRVHGFEKI